jgi:hypothetical protein
VNLDLLREIIMHCDHVRDYDLLRNDMLQFLGTSQDFVALTWMSKRTCTHVRVEK